MDHVVGERVLLRTIKGGGYDPDGNPLPRRSVDEPVDGAVVFYTSTGSFDDVDVVGGEDRSLTVLLPRRYPVEQGAVVVVRGEEWIADRPPFEHRSLFGSDLGGTELFLTRRTA